MVYVSYSHRLIVDYEFIKCLSKHDKKASVISKMLRININSKEHPKNNIVISQTIGTAVNYTLNFDNPETVKLCELLLLEKKRLLSGYVKLYGDSLQKFESAELIILFGSVLTKKEYRDVDVLFVTKKSKEVHTFCLGLSKIRTRPVVPLILTKEDLVNEGKKKKDAIVSLLQEGVILRGESVFVEVMNRVQK